MRKLLSDPLNRGLFITVAIILLAAAGLLAVNFSKFTTDPDSETEKITIADLNGQNVRLYAQVQHETGIPWVLLYSVDKAEKAAPDLARVEAVAKIFVQKGAIQKGLTADPIKNAAELAGLYTNNRKTIEKIAKHMLELSDTYTMFCLGKYPADGGVPTEEANGCRITGITKAISPFDGTVKSISSGSVELACDNGMEIRMEGIWTTPFKAGDRIKAGDVIGDSSSLFVAFFYGGAQTDAYTYILLLQR